MKCNVIVLPFELHESKYNYLVGNIQSLRGACSIRGHEASNPAETLCDCAQAVKSTRANKPQTEELRGV